MKTFAAIVALGGCVLAAGCEDKSPPPMPATRDNPQTPLGRSAQTAREAAKSITAGQDQASAMADGNVSAGDIQAGGLVFRSPSGWQRQPAGGMRAAEFRIPGPEGEATVVFFTGIGGSAMDNINRWRGQVKPDRGGEPRVSEMTLAQSIPAKRISMIGTYTGMSPMGAASQPMPGAKFIGVVIEAPSGQVQIRMTGPLSTVEEAERAFDAMINGVQAK